MIETMRWHCSSVLALALYCGLNFCCGPFNLFGSSFCGPFNLSLLLGAAAGEGRGQDEEKC